MRFSLELAIHILEVMEGIIKSSDIKVIYVIETKAIQSNYLDWSKLKK